MEKLLLVWLIYYCVFCWITIFDIFVKVEFVISR